MYRKLAVVIPLALAACTGDKDTDTAVTETEIPNDSAAPPDPDLTGNFGSILVAEYKPFAFNENTQYAAQAVFASDDGGLANLAACLFGSDACVAAYPLEGETIDGYTGEQFDFFYTAEFFDVGRSIEVGDVTLGLQNYGDLTLYIGYPGGFGGSTGVSYDGDYAPYVGTADFTFAGSMDALAPDPLQALVLTPDSPPIDFAWTTGGTGDVLLDVNNKVTHLADDGLETVDPASFGFEGPLDIGTILLSRSTVTTFDGAGNTIKVQARSNQIYPVTYVDTTNRTELVAGVNAAEDCIGALALDPLGPGAYWGNSSDLTNDQNLGENNPVIYFPSYGNDMVVPISLLAGEELTVDYLHSVDAAAYLLPSTCTEAGALAGADTGYYFDPENFSYTATADETVYLVLDGFYYGGGFFVLELAINQPS